MTVLALFCAKDSPSLVASLTFWVRFSYCFSPQEVVVSSLTSVFHVRSQRAHCLVESVDESLFYVSDIGLGSSSRSPTAAMVR